MYDTRRWCHKKKTNVKYCYPEYFGTWFMLSPVNIHHCSCVDNHLPPLPQPNHICAQTLGISTRTLFAFLPSSAPSSPYFRLVPKDSSSSPADCISDITPFNRICNIKVYWVSVKPISARVFSKDLDKEPALESGDADISCWTGRASVTFEGETAGVELARGTNRVSDGSDALNNLLVVTCVRMTITLPEGGKNEHWPT